MSALAVAGAPRELWYLTRGAGAVTLVGLTATTALGVVRTQRWSSERWPRFVVDAVHRNVALVTLTVLVLHVLAAVIDGFAPISLLDAFIPFRGRYRPLYLGLGAVALDVLVAVTVTSLLRNRIGHRVWRAVHWAAYACWPVAVVHALGTGTDAPIAWMVLLGVVCVAVVLSAVAWRITSTPALAGAPRYAAGGAIVVAMFAGAAWARQGPLASGWAARAGTPASLLSPSARARARARGTRSAASPAAASPFTAGLSGSVRQAVSADGGQAVVQLTLTLSGARTGTLDIRLAGQPIAGGGVNLSSGDVRLAVGRVYTGPITGLSGGTLSAVARSGDGGALRLRIALSIAPDGSSATGTVRGTPA